MMGEEETLVTDADYRIENAACCKKDIDLWIKFKKDIELKYCPFCGRVLTRTIFIKPGRIIAGSLRYPKI